MTEGGPDLPGELIAPDRLRAAQEVEGLAVRPEGRGPRSAPKRPPRPPVPGPAPADPVPPPDPEGRGRNLHIHL